MTWDLWTGLDKIRTALTLIFFFWGLRKRKNKKRKTWFFFYPLKACCSYKCRCFASIQLFWFFAYYLCASWGWKRGSTSSAALTGLPAWQETLKKTRSWGTPSPQRLKQHFPMLLLALGKVPVDVREVSGCFQAVGYLPTTPLPQLSLAFITFFLK